MYEAATSLVRRASSALPIEGATSTTSAPSSGNAAPIRAINDRTKSGERPFGSGAPVEGAASLSVASMSFDR